MPAEEDLGPLVRATAPGRVNLIGDHTDYAGGLVLPMAIDRATTVTVRRGGRRVELRSGVEARPAVVELDAPGVPSRAEPAWARYVAGVAAVVHPDTGATGIVESTVPPGAGLSSSAALEVSVALALGAHGSALEVARACQEAEHLASGVPCGIMDQLCSTAGVAGSALLIDCRTFDVSPVPVPDDVSIVVVHSGESRVLARSPYAERRAQVESAAHAIGASLGDAAEDDLAPIADPLVRRRARHVVTENARVRAFVDALRDDPRAAGALMVRSHNSLRDDFEVSTPVLDALVDRLCAMPGVLGARLTGAGFGGCVVALVEEPAGAATAAAFETAWVVRPSGGASVETLAA